MRDEAFEWRQARGTEEPQKRTRALERHRARHGLIDRHDFKVLRGHSDISEETRKRVLKRMKELHYQPNFAARALITGRTWTLGLVVPDLLHPFFADVAKAISAEIRGHGYSLMITSSEEDPELERQEIEGLLARRVDALLIASAQSTVESFASSKSGEFPMFSSIADLKASRQILWGWMMKPSACSQQIT